MDPATIATIMAGIAGVGGALTGSKGGTKETAVGYGDPTRGRYMGIDPLTTLGKALGNVENLGGVLTERANQPITLPGAFAQQPHTMWGGGIPMPIGLSGFDPALLNPQLLGLPGVRFPEPELQPNEQGEWHPVDYYGPKAAGMEGVGANEPPQARGWMFPGAQRRQQTYETDSTGAPIARQADYFGGGYNALHQPPPHIPQLGGGIPGLADALRLLGVEEDPFNRLVTGRNYPFGGGGGGGGGSPIDPGVGSAMQWRVPGDPGQTPSGVYGTGGAGKSTWQGPEPPGAETLGGSIWPDQGGREAGGYPSGGPDAWGGERGGGWNPYIGMDDYRGMGPGFTDWSMSGYEGGAFRPGGLQEGYNNPFWSPPSPSGGAIIPPWVKAGQQSG